VEDESVSIITIKAEDLRDPLKSERTRIGEEDAAHCDGGPCGEMLSDLMGEPLSPGPHHHVVVSGENPAASPRYLAVFSSK